MLDKDGIFSAVRMAELLAYLERQGKTLLQLLDDLYDRQASNSHVLCLFTLDTIHLTWHPRLLSLQIWLPSRRIVLFDDIGPEEGDRPIQETEELSERKRPNKEIKRRWDCVSPGMYSETSLKSKASTWCHALTTHKLNAPILLRETNNG